MIIEKQNQDSLICDVEEPTWAVTSLCDYKEIEDQEESVKPSPNDALEITEIENKSDKLGGRNKNLVRASHNNFHLLLYFKYKLFSASFWLLLNFFEVFNYI
ncbi:hypothetical protein [Sodalis sp.]|uniref:hypothetical protein n=1 Tax=Sodalis sp. (in: enterobacteria) TaxID=1898979 RepID=UPI003872D6FF